jgi:hypothetical protein
MAKKRITDYPEATELSNDDYIWIDDGTENGSKKFLAKNLGGVTPEADIERLCYIVYVRRDTEEIPTISTQTLDDKFSDYLQYDPTTKKFTVLQDFNALIVPWTYNYDTASSTYSHGEFYINETVVSSWTVDYTGERYYRGKPLVTQLHSGDTFYNYTPMSDGYPQQNLKIYKLGSQDAIDTITDLFTFYNMYGNVEGRAAES